MKNFFSILFFVFTLQLFSQTPQGFNYSAVARDATGKPIANRNVSVQLSILKTSPTGTLQYTENHSVITDGYGLFNLVAGNGTVQSGSMSNIQWGSANHYLKVAIDANGGNNFVTMGTTQIMSVPYALNAKKADNGIDRVSANGDSLYLSNGQVFVAGGNTSSLVLPTIVTNPVTGITSNSATFGGAISNANGNQIMERGILYSTAPNPTIQSNKIIVGSGIGTFDTITSMNFQYPHFLQPNTQYYVRAYVITENNISSYGNQVSFTTLNLTPPTIITNAIIGITSNSATFSGNITSANGNQIVERGIVYSISQNPTLASNIITVGMGLGAFDTITSMNWQYPHFLQPNTQYYVRAYAITENNITSYGNQVSFTTLNLTPPTITTNAVTGITSNSATFSGAISNTNGNQIVESGIVYSTTPNPTIGSNKIVIGNGISPFDTISALGYQYPHLLTPNTTYYVRAYAVSENNNSAIGDEVSFTTLSVGQTGPGGGIVFFDKGNSNGGWRYLECASIDQSTVIAWGCNAISIPGTQPTVGRGEANTSLIVTGCNEASFAAKLCNDLVLGGQDNWFLPSIEELNLMFKNLHQNNLGNFPINSYYWSSTEIAPNASWTFYFGANGNTGRGSRIKNETNYVRAVRSF